MRRTLIAAALLIGAAACANQPSSTGVASVANASDKPSATPSATAGVDPEEQGRKFAKCMREHGVDVPDPEPGKGVQFAVKADGDKDKFKQAMDACRSFAPFKDRAQMTPEDLDKMRNFAKCMREHGVDMPDPDPSGNMVMTKKKDTRFDPDNPAFKQALETCRSQMPQMKVKQ
ncbi:hypothetical protein ACIBHX_37205 [Nonomuraea sp. NPDC050536]|uniref:hypothetical protein n=1 Tax=Nonomuraea sp. NPDC050536 TaxID=3364366 RepID=UPI0037C6CEAD